MHSYAGSIIILVPKVDSNRWAMPTPVTNVQTPELRMGPVSPMPVQWANLALTPFLLMVRYVVLLELDPTGFPKFGLY
mgnify:CR=1 FL=1